VSGESSGERHLNECSGGGNASATSLGARGWAVRAPTPTRSTSRTSSPQLLASYNIIGELQVSVKRYIGSALNRRSALSACRGLSHAGQFRSAPSVRGFRALERRERSNMGFGSSERERRVPLTATVTSTSGISERCNYSLGFVFIASFHVSTSGAIACSMFFPRSMASAASLPASYAMSAMTSATA